MKHFHALTTSLALTAGLTICASARAQSGLQTVPVRPPQDTGTQLGEAAARLDRGIQFVRSGIVRGDQRPDDLETLLDSADAWVRAAGTDLGIEGTELVQRQLGRAGTNLLRRSSDSVLTQQDLDDFEAAVLDARVERALRRLARGVSAGSWSPSDHADVLDLWTARVDFEAERQRGRKAAGIAAPDKPQKVRGYGGPGKTIAKKRNLKSAGVTQPEIIIDRGGRHATGVGQTEPVLRLQDSLDWTALHMRGKKAAGLENAFLVITEFRMEVALRRYREMADAGQDTTLHQLHMFDLALERQKQAALAGRPK